MDSTTLAAQAELFHSLHTTARPLALANAWDVASALVIEAAGASAIATTSAGISWSLGVPDGDALDREEALAVIERIVAAVEVPVTADVEGGYATNAAEIASTVDRLLDAGVVGLNIEDGTREPSELAARIVVARRTAERAGVPLFVNARADVYWRSLGEPEQRIAETVARASRYVDAGADGIFIPGVVDAETVATLASQISVPVNILVGAGAPTVAELGRLGVARASLGSGAARAAYAAAQRAARELFATGSYEATADGFGYAELDGMLAAAGH
jgi:2-methylisocitrate lyase-like PEP mutase family enzyme